MKRSEMLKIIEEYLVMHCQPKFCDAPHTAMANDILTIIENNGMLPPTFQYYSTGEYEPSQKVVEMMSDDYDGGVCWEDDVEEQE